MKTKVGRPAKNFFWRDKSGRGLTNNFTLTELCKSFTGETDRSGEYVAGWARLADVGEKWENEIHEITRTL